MVPVTVRDHQSKLSMSLHDNIDGIAASPRHGSCDTIQNNVGCIPVVLVHGWNSHPGIWNRLVPSLNAASIPHWRFDYSSVHDATPGEIAHLLGDYIGEERKESGYFGPVDIVCHSMGNCIVRYLLEVIDGRRKGEDVRQLIGIGPPNNGSAMAELFCDPEHGSRVIDRLAGVFVPPGYEPASDPIVQEIRPGSRTVSQLHSAGIRNDISYRIIMAANLTASPEFFPWFEGKTWEFDPRGGWQTTFLGDGVIPCSEAFLPGAGIDLLPVDPGALAGEPGEYCHITLPRNREVVARVMEYLTRPSTPPLENFPPGTGGA
jgi:triacylglycerol lipase